jgi:hypothetical protein
MAEAANQAPEPPEEGAEVIDLFAYARRPPLERATPAELAEYRRIKPLLLQMLREWEAVKGSGGCPIARRITMTD